MLSSNFISKEWNLDSEQKIRYLEKLTQKGIISLNYSNNISSFIVQKDKPTILMSRKSFKKFLIDKARTYDFCEILRLDQSRLFFDIDIKTVEEDTLNRLEKLMDIIKSIFNSTNTIIKGVIECKNDEWLTLDYLNYPNVITIKNNNQNSKDISGHLYLTGKYYNRLDIETFFKNIKSTYFQNDDMFDCSVYKTGQQAFRHPYSSKKLDNRPINDLLFNHPKFLEGVDFVCAPSEEDQEGNKLDFEQCINNIESLGYQKYKEPKINTKITPKLIKQEEQKQEDEELIDDSIKASIFSIVHSISNDCDIELFSIGSELNHFELAQDLYFFNSLPLSLEEFTEEILLIKPDLNLDKFFKKFTYVQDYTTLSKLTYLKKLHYKYIEDRKKQCEGEIDLETKNDISICYTAINQLDQYYIKYWKEDFIRHNFIKFEDNKRNKTISQYLLYNCFKLEEENTIYQVNSDLTLDRYKNITSLANKFRLSGTTANRLYQNMVTFKSIREFRLMILESKYQGEKVDDLLDMLKNTFVYESDYNYYISWLANKITYQTTNKRGIISQPEKDGGCDSLKTYMTKLLDPFIEINTANIRNLNKPLNGTYFKGLLTVIEELPKKLTDVENLIAILKENTQAKTITIEEKGEKPITLQNRTDIIMNTNFNVEKLFYLKTDASAMSKRFRILTRKSIDIKKYSDVLDKYSDDDVNYLNAYNFYRYLLNNDELIKYYKEHKNDKSEIENNYQRLAVDFDDTDRMITHLTKQEFIQDFKNNYVDRKKNIKLNLFLTLFKEHGLFKDIKQKSFKRLLTLRKCVHLSEDNRTYINDKEIENIYDNFFIYEEDEENENEKII